MGWIGYRATYFKPNGSIDRKAELDHELFSMEGEYRAKLLKSSVVGATYYAAVQSPDGQVWGLVVCTRVARRPVDGCTFFYKDMSEDMGPLYYDCPHSILSLLTPTDNAFANEWREKCRVKYEKKRDQNALGNLPVGSRIHFHTVAAEYTLEKMPPAHQFKRAFWYSRDGGFSYPRKYIPEDYEVVYCPQRQGLKKH